MPLHGTQIKLNFPHFPQWPTSKFPSCVQHLGLLIQLKIVVVLARFTTGRTEHTKRVAPSIFTAADFIKMLGRKNFLANRALQNIRNSLFDHADLSASNSDSRASTLAINF